MLTKIFKYIKYIFIMFLLIFMPAFANTKIQYNESLLPYKGGILISNFGFSMSIKDKCGYILYYKKGKLNTFIPTGNLNKPTGMAIYKNKLYICDRDRLWVYSLKNLNEKPLCVMLNSYDKEINDVAIKNGVLYITVTNSDRVYKLDLKQKILKPELWINIPSPNGIAIKGKKVYISSITKDYINVKDENVIYVIEDITSPKIKKLNKTPLLYDGIAVSRNGKTIYVSDWLTSSIIAIDNEGLEKIIYTKKGMTPADITLIGNKIIIPNMQNHNVIILNLKNLKEKIIGI